MKRMNSTAVRKPRPGMRRPKTRWYPGEKNVSMKSQNTYRSHALAMAGTVTKNPVMKRTLNQFRTGLDMIFR